MENSSRFVPAGLVSADQTVIGNDADIVIATWNLNRQIIANTCDGLIVADRQMRYLVWNPGMEAISGVRADEVLGKKPFDLFPFLRDVGLESLFERALAGETLTTPDFPYEVPATGRKGWTSQTMAPLRSDADEIIGVIIAVRDVTQRKQTEDALRLFRTLIDHSSDAIEVVDPQTGRFLDVNQQSCHDLGYSRSELLSMAVFDIDPDLAGPDFFEFMVRVRDAGFLTLERRHKRKDGSIFPIEVNIRSVVLDRPYIVAACRDITQRKRADEERRQLEAQIQRSQKLESLGLLAGGIAHDFNNLLTAMLGYAELARMHLPADSRAVPMIGEIEQAAERAAELATQMLAYSGRGKFSISPVRLDQLVRQMSTLLSTAVSRKAELRLELDPVTIEGDATQIRQIVMNLITNASEALEANNGVIVMRTGLRQVDAVELRSPFLHDKLPSGRYGFVEVQDSGSGMSEATLSKIFDPFFTTKSTGRGLGLAAVLGIIRGHRGSIQVSSGRGAGTTFRIYIPAVAQEGALDSTGKQGAVEQRGSGTILVVDDEESVVRLAASTLTNFGFQVLTANDGIQGTRAFERHRREILGVVLDLSMPQLGGFEVAQRIRQVSPELPILFISGFSEQDAAQRLVEIQHAGFLRKPFRPSELLESLHRLIPRS